MKAGSPPKNPFPGLRPFKAEESTLFFGRDEQIGEALDRLLRQKLLAVVGVSGCGKSSLVTAGMLPALEMGLAGDPEQRWRFATMRPGDGPLRELAACLGLETGKLVERTYGLLEAVEAQLRPGENLLLVVDQFEEIFPFRDRKLREGAGSEADLFVSYLLRASQEPGGRVNIILTMRSDYLGECAKFHGLPETLNDGQYLVPRMTRTQLQEAIEGPLQSAGVDIHPSLVQDLLNQCDEEPDNLPLLQHLLRRMFEQWEIEGGQGPITAAMAATVGGLAKALDQDAEAVYDGLSENDRRISEVLFRRITESRPAGGDADNRPIRRPQPMAKLARLAHVTEEELRTVSACFERRALLVVRDTDDGLKADLPHECLCLKWTRLTKWILAEAEDAKNLRFLWDATERKAPLAGLALSEAMEFKRDGRLDEERCSRYLNSAQVARVHAWVDESLRIVEEAKDRERQATLARAREAESRRLALRRERGLNLEERGWGVVFAKPLENRARPALKPLLDLRAKQAGQRYREVTIDPAESASKLMNRFQKGGTLEGSPSYLLLVGDPEQIPFNVQYELATQYAVGRLYFDDPTQYAAYADGVLHSESSEPKELQRAALFAPANGDPATGLLQQLLVKPVLDSFRTSRSAWTRYAWVMDGIVGEEATKSALSRELAIGPDLLFIAGHGMSLPATDARQEEVQGAVICSDFKVASGPVRPEQSFAAADVTGKTTGIVFAFLPYGAGTPKDDDFTGPEAAARKTAERSFLSKLPQRLLSAGTLAVVSHVDRNWAYSFRDNEAKPSIDVFAGFLRKIMSGATVGLAMEQFRQRTAREAGVVLELFQPRDPGQKENSSPSPLQSQAVVNRLIAAKDMRNYIVLGDPAVALRMQDEVSAPVSEKR